MIIVEGPDGAGKTTFIEKVSRELDLPIAPKFVKSSGEGSGTNDLFGEAYKDVVTMWDRPPMIYDRHPLISEYVYGPIIRGAMPPDFLTPQAHATMRLMAQQVFVIWALPPMQTCYDNVMDETSDQMNGVQKNIDAIWAMYHTMRMLWQGSSSMYDYTAKNDSPYGYSQQLMYTRLHAATHVVRMGK